MKIEFIDGGFMKTLGMLGGMSYESTVVYYHIINQEVNRILKNSHSASIAMISFDYQELEDLLKKNEWETITKILVNAGNKLKVAGAHQLMICANTMHIVADEIEKQVGLKVIHIAKETLNAISHEHIDKVGLIGTLYTMQSQIYPDIAKTMGIDIITPHEDDQKIIHDVIYKELIVGIKSEQSKQKIIDIINNMGVNGIILGCTELPLLIKQEDLSIAYFDTLKIHALSAAKWLCEGETYDI